MDVQFFPKLIEPGVKYFLNKSLENCNVNKIKFYNTLVNLFLLFMFIVVIGVFLIYKKKTKLSIQEKKQKDLIEKKYILEKIRKLNIEKQNQQQEMASNIPKFESTFVQLHKNYYNN